MSTDISDEVVAEFPIGTSPLSSAKESLQSIRVKPKHKKIELEVTLNTESKNFDRSKAQQIADIANEAQNEEEPYFPDNIMDKQVLRAIQVNPHLKQYAVGVINDDCKELHLTPISSVMQFRPSFHYFDKTEIRVNKAISSVKEDPAAFSEEESEVKRINMRFAGPDEEKAKKAREMSYSYLQQQLAAEPWVDFHCYDSEDIVSQNERRLLLHNANDERETEAHDSGNPISSIDEYLSSLVLDDVSAKPSSSVNPVRKSSLGSIKGLSLPDQVRTLIVNAKVLSFTELKEHLCYSSDENTILRYLQQFAMLVQGNWVVKSEILYPKESDVTISPVSGIPIEILCRTRDYVMWLFTQSTSVCRKDVIKEAKVPEEDVLLILKHISVYNSNTKRWDFILPVDNEFIKRYSDVVTRQKMLWEVRYVQLDRSAKGRRDSLSTDDVKFSSPTAIPRKRRRSRRDSSTSGTDVSENESKEPLSEKKKATSKRKQNNRSKR